MACGPGSGGSGPGAGQEASGGDAGVGASAGAGAQGSGADAPSGGTDSGGTDSGGSDSGGGAPGSGGAHGGAPGVGGEGSGGALGGSAGLGGEGSDAPCEDACAAATTRCEVGQLYQCTKGADGCWDWGAPTACSSGDCGSEQACASSLGDSCASRASCRHEFPRTCFGEEPPACQCDPGCVAAGDCCADVETACADARQDETDILSALQMGDADTVGQIVARDRFDPAAAFSQALQNPEQWPLLLNAGAPINVQNRVGYTPIMSTLARLEQVQMLIDAGADLEARNGDCLTVLMKRIRDSSDISIANLIIDSGADVNAVTPNGNTALLFAISSFRGGPVYKMLQEGADPNHANSDGMSPLTVAIRHSRPGVFKRLVEFGADLNGVGPEGEPVWVYALVDNAPSPSFLGQADDELVEWLFTHPDLVVDLDAPGAADAIAYGLTRNPVVHYTEYLVRRGEDDPTLDDGVLLGVHDGSEVRLLGEHITKNGYDLTPPTFELAGRPWFWFGTRYYFPIATDEVAPGFGSVNGADYSLRFVAFDVSDWNWYIDTGYVNFRGIDSYEIEPYLSGIKITVNIPGQSSRSRTYTMSKYTRPYRR